MLKSPRKIFLLHLCLQAESVCLEFRGSYFGKVINKSFQPVFDCLQINKFRRKYFRFIQKSIFLDVIYIPSDIASNASNVSFSISTKQTIDYYLDFRLRKKFTKFRFKNSYYSCIARFGCMLKFVNFRKKADDI